MTFGVSAHLAAMHGPASKTAVEAEVRKLLAILGETDPSLISELTGATVPQSMLADLSLWNARLAPSEQRDRLGHAATKFFAAQTLVATVMRPKALDLSVRYSPGIKRSMECGADGLFEVGRSQFEALGRTASELVSWIGERDFESFAIIESPLGNSLPVQIVCDLASRRGIESVPVEWNPPRNDRPTHGRTIAEASRACVEATAQSTLVVLMDEAITGTRFTKLFDALVDQIGRERFLPIVMRFEDTFQRGMAENPNRVRLARRVEEQGRQIGYPSPMVEFPLQRLFKIDAGGHSRWESPIMWGDSDLIAGKRKVNLIFTLIDHCFGILEDLGAEESHFRAYLERAWQQDTTGAMVGFQPGLVRSVFCGIIDELPLEELQSSLWDAAKERFPEDYKGEPFGLHEEGVKERWGWFREAFLVAAGKRLDEPRAAVAWRAIDDTFAASFCDHKPRPGRDHDAAPYTFPFNETIAALNVRLRERICASV